MIEKWIGDADCQYCEGNGWALSGANLVMAEGSTFCPGYMARIESMGPFDWKVDKFSNQYTRNAELLDVLLFRNEFGRGFLCGRNP